MWNRWLKRFHLYFQIRQSKMEKSVTGHLHFWNDLNGRLPKQSKPCVHMQPLCPQCSLLCPLHWAPPSPLTFQPTAFYVFLSASQRSATKPYTCAIMTSESLGDASASVTWNSAHVWPGKSSVKESATQVRRPLLFLGSDCVWRLFSALLLFPLSCLDPAVNITIS